MGGQDTQLSPGRHFPAVIIPSSVPCLGPKPTYSLISAGSVSERGD